MNTGKLITWLFLALAAVYWLAETVFDFLFFLPDRSLIDNLFVFRDARELLMRTTGFVIILAFGFVISRIVFRKEKTSRSVARNKELLATILNSIGDAIITTDMKGMVTNINPVAENLTGFSLDDARGLHFSEIIKLTDESTGKAFNFQLDNLLDSRSQELVPDGMFISSRHGGRIAIEASISPIYDRLSHKIHGSLMIFREVTEELSTLNALFESEQRFRSIISSTMDGIHLIDENGRIIEWNPALEKILGLRKQDMLGKNYREVQDLFEYPAGQLAGNMDAINEQARQMILTGKSELDGSIIEIRLKTRNHGLRTFQQQLFAVPHNAGFRIASVIHDISELKDSQLMMKESEEKFSKVFSMSPNAIIITSLAGGVILDVNQHFSKASGYKREELIGKSTLELGFWKSAFERQGLVDEIRQRDDHSVRTREFDLTLANGLSMIISVSFTLIDIQGEECLIVFAMDITGRKRLEEEIKLSQVELEQRVRERTQQLEMTNIELEQINSELIKEVQVRLRAESALNRSEDKFRQLVCQLPVGVYRTTVDGTFLQANPALAAILGFDDVEDLMKVNASIFYPEDNEREAFLDEFKSTIGIKCLELELRRYDGKRIWVRDTGRAFIGDSGEIEFTDGIIEDITDKRKTEMALKESEERYRLLFEKLHDIYFRIDNEGTILTISPSAEGIFGYTTRELTGSNINMIIDEPEAVNEFMEKIKIDGKINNYMYKFRRKDGTDGFISTDAHLIKRKNGDAGGIEGISHDITSDIKYQKFLAVMFNISKAINSSESLDELYSTIHSSLSGIVDSRNFYIALVDRSKDMLSFPYFSDQYDSVMPDVSLGDSRFLTPRVINEARTVVIDEKQMIDHCLRSGDNGGRIAKIWVGIPLRIKDEIIGAIALQSYSNPNLYKVEDIEVLESVSDQIAIAIDRKRAQMALNFQLDFLQNLIDTIPNPVYYKDAATRKYIGCNKGYEQYLGMKRDEIIGKSVFDIFPYDSAVFYNEKDIEILYDGKIQQYEDIVTLGDGSRHHTLFFRSCYSGADGAVAGIVGIVLDINNIKAAEENAKEARDYAELLFKVTPSCIFTVDTDRRITSWNERSVQLTGYSPEEVLGRQCDLCPDFINYGVCPLFDPNVKKPVFGKESRLVTKSGEEKIIFLNIDTLRNSKGEVIGGIESFEDITGRKEIEEALFWEAGINSAFAELSKAIITQASLDKISEIILEHAQNLTGSKLGYVGYIDPQTKYFILQTYTKNTFMNGDRRDPLVFKDFRGLLGWSLTNRKSILTNNAIADERAMGVPFGHLPIERYIAAPAIFGDELVGQIGLANSPTDYDERDLEVIDKLASLYALAIQRIRVEQEVRRALEKEQELNELKSNFISMVSHEYRTPLQAILMSTQLLSDYGTQLSDDHKKKYFDIIGQSVQTMETLLQDIITYNKIDINKREYNPDDVDIEKFCLNVTYEMQYTAKGKCSIELTIDKGEAFTVKLDEKLLRQALSSIFSNAIKYTMENTEIKFNVRVHDHNLIIEIVDQGIGIPDEDQKSIFEPFYRGKNVKTISGTGLGLAIAKNSVSAQDGTILFTSKEGAGSTFTVIIPV